MAGKLITVVGKQTFSVSFSTTNYTLVTIGARTYDVSDAVSGTLVVRLYSSSGVPAGGTVYVVMVNSVVMPDDPGTIYAYPVNTNVAYVTMTGNFSTPQLFESSFNALQTSPPLGPMVSFGIQTNEPGAGTGIITMGVDLLVRTT